MVPQDIENCCMRLGLVCLSALCLTLAACVSAPTRTSTTTTEKPPPVWPQPPDPARFAYETTLRSAADIRQESEQERLRRLMTGISAIPDKPAFEKPFAVAARRGRIYVADTVQRQVVVFDVPRRRLFRFGWRDEGRIVKPTALAIDDSGLVYVMDATSRQVRVYDALGLFQRALGNPNDFERPVGLAVRSDGSRIYVVDRADNESEHHRVIALDREGNKLFELGPRGAAPGQFNIPVAAAVAPDGTLYVLDAGNFRVQAFSPDGHFLFAFGGVGSGPGQFARPRGIAVDRDGRIYVSDASFGNVQIFDRKGRLLLTIGAQSKSDGPGLYGLVAGIAVDETGRLYVADQLFNKIEVIRPVTRKRPTVGNHMQDME